MRLVVADTSPINYLLLIGHIDLLPALFGGVILPSVVRDELAHPKAPVLRDAFARNKRTNFRHWQDTMNALVVEWKSP